MTTPASQRLLRWKWALVAVGLPVLVALWWAFRPEKLWINQKVNEPAPFDTSDNPQPILTGRFESKAQQTSGRATIYKKAGGEEYLRLSDFASQAGQDVHVALAQGDDRIDLGPVKSDQGDYNYNLPAATDLGKYDAVVIYGEQSHAVLGLAKLEQF
jgi:Electron transfer DM13